MVIVNKEKKIMVDVRCCVGELLSECSEVTIEYSETLTHTDKTRN